MPVNEALWVPLFSGGGFLASVLALRRVALPPGTMAEAPPPLYLRRRRAVFWRMGVWGVAVPVALAAYGSRPAAGALFALAAVGLALQIVYDFVRGAARKDSSGGMIGD